MKTIEDYIQKEVEKELDRLDMKWNRAESLRQSYKQIAKTEQIQTQILAEAIAQQVVISSIREALFKLLKTDDEGEE